MNSLYSWANFLAPDPTNPFSKLKDLLYTVFVDGKSVVVTAAVVVLLVGLTFWAGWWGSTHQRIGKALVIGAVLVACATLFIPGIISWAHSGRSTYHKSTFNAIIPVDQSQHYSNQLSMDRFTVNK